MPHRQAPLSLLLVLAPSLTAVLAGCGPSNASESPQGEEAPTGVREREIPKVRVAAVERRGMTQELETTSVLESDNEIQVVPRMAGVVTEVVAEEGDRVSAGDVLARMDDRDERLAVRDAEVALQEAENSANVAHLAVEEAKALWDSAKLSFAQRQRDYDRNRKLFEESETKPLSAQELESSRLELDRALGDERQAEVTWKRRQLEAQAAEITAGRAKVTLERAELALVHCEVLAPIDGVVAERMVRSGNSVGTAEPAYVLTDPTTLRSVFFRPQEELELFAGPNGDAPGSLVFRATTEAYPDHEFEGVIERISPTINAESGQFRVTARMQSEDASGSGPRLLPGMLVRMRIETDRHADALVVPKRALRREGEKRYVLAVEPAAADDDGEYVLREVVVDEGFSDDDFVEVFPAPEDGPLEVGTQVLVVGGRDLTEGDPVALDDSRDRLRRAPEDDAETGVETNAPEAGTPSERTSETMDDDGGASDS